MPATTPNGVPYPLGTDRLMDGDDSIHNLALWVDDAWNTRVILAKTATQNVPDATATVIVWEQEILDPKDLHSTVTNPSRVTIKRAGRYLVSAQIAFNSASTTGYRRIGLRKNGVDVQQNQNPPVTVQQASVVGIMCSVLCAAGDYLEIQGTQTGGAALLVNANNQVFWETWYAGGI